MQQPVDHPSGALNATGSPVTVVSVSEGLLLTIAQIAATLIGLLVVGVFFYIETGYRRLTTFDREAAAFLRATTKLILLLYSMVLGISVALVAFEPHVVTALFAALSVAVFAVLIEMTRRSRELPSAVRRRHAAAWMVWPPTVFALALPWVIGGWPVSAHALVTTLFLVGALSFFITGGLLLFAFDLASVERTIHRNKRSRRDSPVREH